LSASVDIDGPRTKPEEKEIEDATHAIPPNIF